MIDAGIFTGSLKEHLTDKFVLCHLSLGRSSEKVSYYRGSRFAVANSAQVIRTTFTKLVYYDGREMLEMMD